MAFRKGNKYGGKKPGAGRPSKAKMAEKLTARAIYEQAIEKNATDQVKRYLGFAKVDAATSRHLADKILPPVQKLEHSGNVVFGSNVPEDQD